jgi:hypothetical protein
MTRRKSVKKGSVRKSVRKSVKKSSVKSSFSNNPILQAMIRKRRDESKILKEFFSKNSSAGKSQSGALLMTSSVGKSQKANPIKKKWKFKLIAGPKASKEQINLFKNFDKKFIKKEDNQKFLYENIEKYKTKGCWKIYIISLPYKKSELFKINEYLEDFKQNYQMCAPIEILKTQGMDPNEIEEFVSPLIVNGKLGLNTQFVFYKGKYIGGITEMVKYLETHCIKDLGKE